MVGDFIECIFFKIERKKLIFFEIAIWDLRSRAIPCSDFTEKAWKQT